MDNKITVIIENETPLRADELGAMFTAFALDYRDLNRGRKLVVTRLEQGSIIAELVDFAIAAGPYIKDAIEAVKAVKSMTEFVVAVRSLFGKPDLEKPQPVTTRERGSSQVGALRRPSRGSLLRITVR
jgi:hypothetical protein